MGQTWTDLGSGQWKLTITSDNPSDGVPPVFVKGTKDQIIEKLAAAKMNGDRRISELRGGKPVVFGPVSNDIPPQNAPKPMSAADRMTTVAELTNPATVDKALTRVLESVIGPVDTLRQDREEERTERRVRAASEAATTFAEATPDWFPSEHNKKTLVGYMKRMGLNNTDPNQYSQAFEELSAAGLLQIGTQDNNETPPDERQERTAPTPAATPRTPTRQSTGVTSRDISGQPPRPTSRLKYTREQIDRMSKATYRESMKDPEFNRCVEYYAAQDAKRQRRAS